MSFPVLLDACVLLPYQLCDLLLRLAETDMYRPLWSNEILDEVERNLVTSFGKTPQQARRRVNQMRTAFPLADVDNYENLMPAMTNHPKDRHVLAAAVRGGAAVIVTANLRDFPPTALSRYEIEAIHPDEFLQDQLDLDPRRTRRCLTEQRAAYTRPGLSIAEFYRTLRLTVPVFADQTEALEDGQPAQGSYLPPDDLSDGPPTPLPLEIVSDNDAHNAFFPEGAEPDPTTPLGSAYLWWSALLNLDKYRVAIEDLSYNPADWGDYTSVAAELDGWSMMQNVLYCEDAPAQIVYVKFMPDTGWSMRAFDEAPLEVAQILTLVNCPDSWWRVWGISKNYFPSANRVIHGIED
jgi:predicted nucleic acid-binding protein